ncbi:MAG: phosphonate ABC transporter, permease protein PhnE [Spirochaetales bacterium]
MNKFAFLASILFPGLGQILLGQAKRGFFALCTFLTSLGMAYWRFALLAPREPTLLGIIRRSIERRPSFALLVLGLAALVWILGIFDTIKLTKPTPGRSPRGLISFFFVLGSLLFVLGWQISEIDLPRMVKDFNKAVVPLNRVLWPWKAAVTRDSKVLAARVEILEGEGTPPSKPVPVPGKPYIYAEPTVGVSSKLDERGQPIPGTLITLYGSGFEPNTLTAIWWEDPIGSRFQVRKKGEYLTVVTDAQGKFTVQVPIPYSIIPPGAVKGSLIHYAEAQQVFPIGPLKPSAPFLEIISRMVETIVMGLMATILGIFFSIPMSFLAARNIMYGSWIGISIYYFVRFVMNVVRSIEPIIWAVIAVVWVGLGPFAGVIALTVHSIAALGKLYSEAIEGIDHGPIEAIQATGATKLQTIMFAVIPQMISPFISFSIYRWDINVRMSTIIGMVGGGGVGFVLLQYVRLLDYQAAGIAVWFIALTVAILDYLSAEIRERMI